jgi:hypothetical protein
MKISPYKHSYEDRAGSFTGLASLARSHRVIHFIIKSTVRLYEQTGQPTCRDESSKMPRKLFLTTVKTTKCHENINRREIHPTEGALSGAMCPRFFMQKYAVY